MTSPSTSDIVALKPVRVELGSVEKELSSQWKQAAMGELAGVSAPVTRAILSNIIVFAATDDESNEAAAIVSGLMANHPSRAIVADVQPGQPRREIAADVSVLCSISDRGRRLCGEQITIHPHGLQEVVFGTIAPVLAPDLPVYLWTPGDLVWDERVFRQVAGIPDHWIVDSRAFTDWSDSFRRVVSFGPRREPPVMVHDLAWASLSQWRELIAEHFDAPAARKHLDGVSTVEIVHAPGTGGRPSMESILFAAWLATQLTWTEPQVQRGRGGAWTIGASAPGGPVLVKLSPKREERSPISEIVIRCEPDGGSATFRSALLDGHDEVRSEAEAPDIPDVKRTIALEAPSRSREVCTALDTPGRDRLYERALPLIVELVNQIGSEK